MSNRFSPPPKFDGLHCVGWVKSAHGIKGEIFVKLKAPSADWAESAEQLHLLISGQASPQAYDIKYLKPHKDGLIVKLIQVPDRNVAETLAKSTVYIAADLLQSDEGEPIFLAQVLGFNVVDLNGKVLGTIVGFGSNGPQDLLRLQVPGSRHEALVPFIDEFIEHIDFDKNQVSMDLPAGLIDLEEE